MLMYYSCTPGIEEEEHLVAVAAEAINSILLQFNPLPKYYGQRAQTK